jgi:choloylglycine hydrolase
MNPNESLFLEFQSKMKTNFAKSLCFAAALCTPLSNFTNACTGITLISKDGAVVFGRTLEWGSFDLHSRLVVVPRGYEYRSELTDGEHGLTWTAKYGAVGLDAVGKDLVVDGMNERGLCVNVFYHPGSAEYPAFDPAKSERTMGSLDVCQYLLTTCSSTDEVRAALAEVHIVGVTEPAIGIAPPIHLIVTEPGGKAIVVEFTAGVVTFHDAPLGVITNSPNYDWHMTNLRNYVNLSPVAIPTKKLEELDFAPLGGGSGMIGLPGDFTPPSRFVRAVAFSKSARPVATGTEAMYELFRILDNFNIPLGAAEGEESKTKLEGLRSATLWTTVYDSKNLVMQFHTQHNRRVRQVDLKKIDFSQGGDLQRLPLDQVKSQDILDVTPVK